MVSCQKLVSSQDLQSQNHKKINSADNPKEPGGLPLWLGLDRGVQTGWCLEGGRVRPWAGDRVTLGVLIYEQCDNKRMLLNITTAAAKTKSWPCKQRNSESSHPGKHRVRRDLRRPYTSTSGWSDTSDNWKPTPNPEDGGESDSMFT